MTSNLEIYAEQAPTPILFLEAENRVVFANKAFCNMLPPRAPRPEGQTIDSLPLPTMFVSQLCEELMQVETDSSEHKFTFEQNAPDKKQWNCRIIPMADAGNIVIEIQQTDALSFKKALQNEKVLRHQSDMLRHHGRKLFFDVIDEMPMFVYMQRRDYTVAYANKKTLAFYGENKNRKCFEMFAGRTSPCPHCPTFRVFDTGSPVDWEFTDEDGRTFHIYDYPFEDENGDPLVMEMGVDITELRRVERELFQAQKMRAIGVLAGGIAHDLNNNLVPIIFNTDYALDKATGTEIETPLSEALSAAYKAAELVEQVLEYSRQQEVTRSPLLLTPLAKENLDILQASLPNQISLKASYKADQDCILANPSQIQQILLNLCRNAVQAMPDGGTLSVSISNLFLESQKEAPHPGLGLGSHVVMTISDTGHGIDPSSIERIFEPFYTSKGKTGGTGMGLAVVHAIASCNGGSIHVDSDPGKGTTFTVYLPCTTPETKTLSEEVIPTSFTVGRLLLVDDDSGALQAMQRVLRDAGYEVFTADNGNEGLKEFFRAKGQFDLIITDQSMPSMTGMEMASRILEHYPDSKVLICTGHVEPRLKSEAENMGISGFVMKPMSPRVLVENVSKYCV